MAIEFLLPVFEIDITVKLLTTCLLVDVVTKHRERIDLEFMPCLVDLLQCHLGVNFIVHVNSE
jgi:hypothetical protein